MSSVSYVSVYDCIGVYRCGVYRSVSVSVCPCISQSPLTCPIYLNTVYREPFQASVSRRGCGGGGGGCGGDVPLCVCLCALCFFWCGD